MKRLAMLIFLFGLLSIVNMPKAEANGLYFSQIPKDKGLEQSCNLCHTAPPSLNDFGQDFKASDFDFQVLLGEAEEPAGEEENTPAEVPGVGQSQGKQDADIQLILPNDAARGEKIQLQAKVTADGKPIAGKQIQFFEETDFFSGGKIDLGSAATGTDGIAVLNYWPRAVNENVKISAKVEGDNQIAGEAEGVLALAVEGALYQSAKAEGLAIPFLGPWVIALFVGAIWGTYFYVGYKTLEIGKLGKVREQEVFQEAEERKEAQA